MHIYVVNQVIIGSDNGLVPIIIWSKAVLLLISLNFKHNATIFMYEIDFKNCAEMMAILFR